MSIDSSGLAAMNMIRKKAIAGVRPNARPREISRLKIAALVGYNPSLVIMAEPSLLVGAFKSRYEAEKARVVFALRHVELTTNFVSVVSLNSQREFGLLFGAVPTLSVTQSCWNLSAYKLSCSVVDIETSVD